MSFASFDRRLRRIESTVGSDDPRRFLHLPLREWPTVVLDRVLAMTDAERAALLDEPGARSIVFADLAPRQPGCDDGTLVPGFAQAAGPRGGKRSPDECSL